MDDTTSPRGRRRPADSGLPLLPRWAFRPTPEQIGDALRSGRLLPDETFDRFMPDDLQAMSSQYWTPLCVVQRAARWLDELDVRTVLDIGSGAGKLCVAAALAGRCSFVGLEQRPKLVAAARALAATFEVEDRVRFIEGTLGDTELPGADAYYLYNPFGENLWEDDDRIDGGVELSFERYRKDVALAEELIRRAPVGACLITYNGFGGSVPADYQEVRLDRELPNVLRMWRKVISPSQR